MVRGLFTAYTGMLGEQKRLDVISNNIANAATVGFKKDGVTNQSFDEVLTHKVNDASSGSVTTQIGSMSLGVKIGEVYTDFSQGSLRETGNDFDLAIEGKGFFQVAVVDEQGNTQTMYTRDGSFKKDSQGYIVDTDGNRLIGANGEIQIPMDTVEVIIDNQGNLYCNGQFLDQIQVVDFEDYSYIQKFGSNLYQAVEGATPNETNSLIHQGYTEQSNVQAVSEMVNMIAVTRAYEANQKVISTIDSMLDKSVNSVGKVQ